NERRQLAWLDPKRDVIQRWSLQFRAVAERDIVKGHLATDLHRGERDGARAICDLVRHVEIFEYAIEEGQSPLKFDLNVEQLADWEEDPALQRGEGDQRANDLGSLLWASRVARAEGKVALEQIDERRHDGEEGGDKGEEPAPQHLLANLQTDKLLVL